MLPQHATAVVVKTPAATVMAGAQTTINNQLKAATTMATEMAMMKAMTMIMEMKAMGGESVEAAQRRKPAWQLRSAWRVRRQLDKSAALAAVTA